MAPYAFSTAIRASSRRPRRSATSRQIRRSAHRLRQQDGQDRRRYFRCVDEIKTKVGGRPICVQLPIGSESDFKGIIDLVRMKAVVWEEEGLGAKYHDEDIPSQLLVQAEEYRHMLIEAAVELDDDVMSAYLDGAAPDIETLKRCIRKAVRQITFIPILCGSAFKNKGVQPLLDAVVDYLPSPVDRGAIKGIDVNTGEEILRLPKDSEPFSMLGFKIMDDPFVGTITFCRIYSGKIESGTTVLNSTKDKRERVGRMLLMHANNREDIKEAFAGDIVALAGLKDTRTGDTLCDLHKPVILEKMEFPGTGHRNRHRAEVESRPGEARRRAGQACRRGPLVPRLDRSGIGPDHPEGHGRTASRHQGRHLAPHLQGRRQYRRAAGRLSREADQARSRSTTPTRSRPAAPASSPR